MNGWLDQGMIDDLNGKPYREGPALKRGDKVGFQTEDGEILYGYLGDEVTHKGTDVVTMTFSREPAIPREEQSPREHPNHLNRVVEDRLECLIEGLQPWQQDLARKAFGPGKLEVLVPRPRRHGRARGFEMIAMLLDEIEYANGGVVDAATDATKALKAMPKPSSPPPMWANDVNRSRRPRRNRNQPNRQGIQ